MTDLIHRFVAIAGRTTDQPTRNPVSGVSVSVFSGTPPKAFSIQLNLSAARGNVAVTDPDGFFRFMDLPNGEYELRLQKPGAPVTTVRVPVARTDGVVKPPALVEVELRLGESKGAPASTTAKLKVANHETKRKR